MLNVMKIVRVRVCAQVDLMFGEDVAVLSRLLSYDDRYMMRAALREGDDWVLDAWKKRDILN